MDKYQKKILKFISSQKYNPLKIENKYNISDHLLIKKITEKCKVIKSINTIPSYSINKINKLHNLNEDPLLYLLFRELNQYKIKNVNDFIRFYSYNQHQLNIRNIYNQINDSIKDDIKKTRLLDLYNQIYERKDNRNEISKIFYNNIFVSIDVLQELESFDLNHIIIDSDKDYYLSVYYYDINRDDIDKYLINIIRIIKLMKEINNIFDKELEKINVIMFLGSQKKELFGGSILPISMNSGSSIPTVFASVWRKEEYEKVLIHELLHFICADFHSSNSGYNQIHEAILDKFNVDGKNNPNESYNETLAGIINMCYKSVMLDLNINKIYDIELNFLYLQCAKIIKYFNGNNISDLLNKKIKIKQTTSGLSYLVLKMILFHNIKDTLDFIDSINLKCNNSVTIDKFKTYLIDKINNKSYSDNVNRYISCLISNNKFIIRTMRMSVI